MKYKKLYLYFNIYNLKYNSKIYFKIYILKYKKLYLYFNIYNLKYNSKIYFKIYNLKYINAFHIIQSKLHFINLRKRQTYLFTISCGALSNLSNYGGCRMQWSSME